MDERLYHLITKRIDRLEGKVDQLLEFKWRVLGFALAVSIFAAGIFEVFVVLIQSKGG